MTTCEVCGGSQFTLQDGFYFCDECHTQSQDIREMVTDDAFISSSRTVQTTVVSEQTLASKQRRKEVQKELRGVRQTLSRAEVLNLLLRRWTAALVARGAPANLPRVTARLWEKLLRSNAHRWRPKIKTAVLLLWLALAECEPLCRLSDLLRWARQDVVTVYSAGNELPEDVTCRHGTLLRIARTHNFVKLRNNLLTMARMLRMTLPPPPPLRHLLRHLLSELALPTQLADVVANAARRAPPLDVVAVELEAMALLLVTLKLLLGLDDTTEARNSEVAAARNEAEPDGPRWFVFTEWLEFIREQRVAMGAEDFVELDCRDRELGTVGGQDLCRRRHRQLLFDYYKRDGCFRTNFEYPFSNKNNYYKPEYKVMTTKLFGAAGAPAAPPPTADDDLLRPFGSRLEREGGEPKRRAEVFRHSRVDFLLDESHVRSLQFQGVAVEVTHAAARERLVSRHKLVRAMDSSGSRHGPLDIQLVRSRKQAAPAPEEPPPPRPLPPRDLRLFMPYKEVWRLPVAWEWPHVRAAEYKEVAPTWPANYRCLLEILAARVELTPDQFANYACIAERNVLEHDALFYYRTGRVTRMRKDWKEADEKREGRGGSRKRKNDGSGKRKNDGPGKRKSDARPRKKKRRRVSSGEDTTDVSSVDMKLGSESETDRQSDELSQPSGRYTSVRRDRPRTRSTPLDQ